jgi:hypothetical protein
MNITEKKNKLPLMSTTRKVSRYGLHTDSSLTHWNSRTQRRRKVPDEQATQKIDLNGYMRLLRHLQPLGGLLPHDTNTDHVLLEKPSTKRTMVRQLSNGSREQS